MDKKIIIIGAGGHAKVIADIIIKRDEQLLGFLDDDESKIGKKIIGFPVFGKVKDIDKYKSNARFVIGIGDNNLRKRIILDYQVKWCTLIHPAAQIGLDVEIGEGTVIMANSVINTSSKIGVHCIINTGAIIEHDNIIGDCVHVSPNAALGGTVTIGKFTHIGLGAIVKNNLSICEECVIGAGAVVVKNIEEKGIYVGVPARGICL